MRNYAAFSQKLSAAGEVPASYNNPIIHMDYSDPDAIRVGNKYIMTASSFSHTPGLPILASTDLVHWSLETYALKKLVPEEFYRTVRHGGGVWAPSIRYHKNEFYIYYPDPDFGIYMIKAKDYKGPWSEPILVLSGKGLIDPCPFWDDNGNAYLVHAYAGSRAGIKSIIAMKEMSKDGTKITNEGKIVYDGHDIDPTVEGPKLYKRNKFYYIFVPAGGVSTGWQTVLRSEDIYGPYERKVVMSQGNSVINGPHQGAWVQTPLGKDWFLHFQDKEAYGRVIHLQPMKWINDWPVIGTDEDGDGVGVPIVHFGKNLNNERSDLKANPDDPSKVFHISWLNATPLSLNWQWQANASVDWYYCHDDQLRLYARTLSDNTKNKYDLPNLLMQKFPSEAFEVTTGLDGKGLKDGEDAGLMIFGTDYSWLGLKKVNEKLMLVKVEVKGASDRKPEAFTVIDSSGDFSKLSLKVKVDKGAIGQFSYSVDGEHYISLKETFVAKPGKWVGAKVGIFASSTQKTNDCGFADFRYFNILYTVNNK